MLDVSGRFKRAADSYGKAVRFIPDAVSGHGQETALDGTEPGALDIKGFFVEPESRRRPEGEVDRMRIADVDGSGDDDWLFEVPAAYFPTPPTKDGRVVDGTLNYSVVRVRPRYYKGTPFKYLLTLRLI